MKLYNHELDGFINFLLETELSGRQSRMRTKFVKILNDKFEEFRNDTLQLLEEFSEKDENGVPKKIDVGDGQLQYDISDVGVFNDEYTLLANEQVIIEEKEERLEMFEIVRNCVLNTDRVFKGKDALVYDRYCDILENK